MIQLQAISAKPLRQVTESCRDTVSRVCGGLDVIDTLEHKALIFRTEIHPANIKYLTKALIEDGVTVLDNSLPSDNECNDNEIHLLSLEVTTSHCDTDPSTDTSADLSTNSETNADTKAAQIANS